MRADRLLLVVCPHCHEPLFYPRPLAGKQVPCEACGKTVVVPTAEEADQAADAAAEYTLRPELASAIEPGEEYLTVVCHHCGTRLTATADRQGQMIRCPDCHTEVRLMPSSPQKPRPNRPAAPRNPPKDYQLAGEDLRHLAPENFVLAVCPSCNTRLHPRRQLAGQTIRCPDCGQPVPVPQPAAQSKPHHPLVGEHTLAPPEVLHRPVAKPPVMPQAIAEPIPLAVPPRWTFFSGVWDFPWRPGVVARWSMTALGLTVAMAALLLTYQMAMVAAGVSGVVIAFFVMPTLWITIWAGSYAASCGLAIVRETAEGADEIVDWQSSDWRDWFWPALRTGYHLFLATMLWWGLSRLLSLVWPVAGAWLGSILGGLLVAWIVYPVGFLSSLEADAWLMPLSALVWKSLLTHFRGWLAFYTLSGVLWAAGLGLLGGLAAWSPWAAVTVGGIIGSTLWLIYARLLGRLAWHLTT